MATPTRTLPARERRADALSLLLLFALTLSLYVATLAPTLLWGDDAYFQRTAFSGELRADGGGHWLWLQAARLLLRISSGDVAYRVNLLSALAASATVAALFAAARAARLRRDSSAVVALSLAVSHTFWLHAVRAEVYTLFTFLLALFLWLWLRWSRYCSWPAHVAAASFGLLLLGHQMALLVVPAWALLLWRRRRWLAPRQWFLFAVLFIVGLLPFFIVLRLQIMTTGAVSVPQALHIYFTHAGTDFGGALFALGLSTLPGALAEGLALFGLQFVGVAGILGLLGIGQRWRQHWPTPWLALFLLLLTDGFFAFSYDVSDSFVFFLPAYVVFALFAGAGWETLFAPARWRRWRAAVAPLLLLPILTYAALPGLLDRSGLDPLSARALPGRDANRFFLWPPKHDQWGAAAYAREALAILPAQAVVIADHTPLEPMRYLQVVEGLRRDVTLIKIEPGQDLAPLLATLPPSTPLFLADDNPGYYAWREVPGVHLQPVGPLFRLTRTP